MSLYDQKRIEREWREQFERSVRDHVCSCCGAPVEPMDPSWRWTGGYYEHKCPGVDTQAGYFPAVKREKRG